MRDDRLDPKLHQRRRRHGDHDQVVRGGRNAAPHQDAYQPRHEERREQHHAIDAEQARRQQRIDELGDRLRRRGDDEADLESDPGQRDDTDHDADGSCGRADRERVLGTGLKGLDERNGIDAPTDAGAIERNRSNDDSRHEKHRADVTQVAEDQREQDCVQDRQRGESAHSVAILRGRQADNHCRRDAGKRGQVWRKPVDDDADQQDQRDQGRPAAAQAVTQVGQFFGA